MKGTNSPAANGSTRVTTKSKRRQKSYQPDRNALDALMVLTISHRAFIADSELLSLLQSLKTKRFWSAWFTLSAKATRRRDAALRELLSRVGPTLRSLLPDYYSALPSDDLDRLMDKVKGSLDNYSGPLDDGVFLEWAILRIVHPTAERLLKFYEIYDEGCRSAYAGAWSVLKHCRDLGSDRDAARELVQDTFCKVYSDLDAWGKPGAASIPTRLRAYAKDQARGWRTNRLRQRERFTGLGEVDPTLSDPAKNATTKRT
jgi:hypothetical protein